MGIDGVGAGVISRCVLWRGGASESWLVCFMASEGASHSASFSFSQWLIGCDAPYAQPGGASESWLVGCVADRAPWGRVYQADLWELWLTAEPAGAGLSS
ncbi:hypothetical protein SPLC1_S220020 [Arthrospira platensis C1]|nr:hypothetical protein SPLC1_S220020 [Arthrospira platensis C1]